MRRHAILALSLSNLCFFNAWREVLSPEGFSYLYYWKQYPGYAALEALVINVLLVAILFYAGLNLLRRFGGPQGMKLTYLIFIVTLLRVLNNIRSQFDNLNTSHLREVIGRGGYLAIVIVVLSLLTFAIVRYGLRSVARAATWILLIWSPFGLVGLGQATWLVFKYGPPVTQEKTPAPELKTDPAAKPRVLWLIFDEMDQNLAFAARPEGVRLPEFDRFRAESFFASNAYPPAGHTSQSIPALLTGQLISQVRPIAPSELSLTIPPGDHPVTWSSQSDVFSDARSLGMNTALVGWYHPYCRVIGDRLTHCRWEPGTQRLDSSKLSLKKNLVRQEIDLLRLIPFAYRIFTSRFPDRGRDYGSEHVADTEALAREAKDVVADERFGLVFIHLSVPHPPYIYNRSDEKLISNPTGNYLDNLALADRMFGQLRQRMEQAGAWDRTTIIVSSDHWWRSDYWRNRIFWSKADEAIAGTVDHRVPFMIKLSEQKTGTTFSSQFNTVLTRELIGEIMHGKLTQPDQLATWLELHRTIGESPYQSYDDVE
jgi:hypothetical protein